MQLQSQGLIVNRRDFGESDLLLHIFSEQYGSVHGLVQRPRMKKQAAVYQIGNMVTFVWQGRLASQLGTLRSELLMDYAARLGSGRDTLYAMASACGLLAVIFSDQQSQDDMYRASIWLMSCLQCKDNQQWIKDYVLWEMKLLQEAGYGLALNRCAVTGDTFDLCYMSPKTGAVVKKEVGEPYAKLLFSVPSFLYDNTLVPGKSDIQDAFVFLSHFLHRHFPETVQNTARETLIRDIVSEIYKDKP